MEIFCKYKSHLQQFNYPNIYGYRDEEISGIFSAENRCCLLTWLVRALNSQFIVPSDWSETTETLFADFFNESGFCSSSQKHSFVKGDLSITDEIIIFDRIFNFLENTSQKENIEPPQNANIIEDIEKFLTMDINVFPACGPLKLQSSTKKQQKLKYYNEEIQKLKQNLANCPKPRDCDDVVFSNCKIYDEEQVETNIEKLQEQAKKLKEICSDIRKADNQQKAGKTLSFKPNFGNQLADCHTEVTSVLQFFKNMNLTQFLEAEKKQDMNWFEQNEVSEIVKHHAQASSEIVKLMKAKENE